MDAYSRVIGHEDSKLQERGQTLILQLTKFMQVASAKTHEAVTAWSNRDVDRVRTLASEIIQLERQGDDIVERLVTDVFAKHAYLPQRTEDMHKLVVHIDDVLDVTERAVRLIEVARHFKTPDDLRVISEKCWQCTDLLQDAVKFVFSDFIKAVELSHNVETVREDARDLEYVLLNKLFNDAEKDATYVILLLRVTESIVDIVLTAEEVADLIRHIVIKNI